MECWVPIHEGMARLLIVDDEPQMCELVSTILTDEGYETVPLVDAGQAIERIDAGEQWDLAVLDVMMPGMTGVEVARRLRRRDPDAKILFITGFSDVLFDAQPILWANEAFLEKPFTPNGLSEAVSLSLHGRIRLQHSDPPRKHESTK